MSTTISLDCQASILPTKASLVNSFASISTIPSKLVLQASKLRVDAEEQARSIGADINSELDVGTQKQIDSLLSAAKDIDDILEDAKKVLTIKGVSNPVFDDSRIPEAEWERIITNAIQQYHIYVQSKILELIESLIPVSFEITVSGITIDIVEFFADPQYSIEIKKQIAEKVDSLYAILPDSYKLFGGKYGIDYTTMKVEAIWSYISAELVKGALSLMHKACGDLIEEFDVIWEALSLPELPNLTNLNVQTLVDAEIAKFNVKVVEYTSSLENPEQSLINNRNMLYADLIQSLEGIQLAGYNIISILGSKIDQTVVSSEREIERLVEALRDFGENYPKKLFLEWMQTVFDFFDQIGLGVLLDWITFTFCDFLKIIGMPASITVPKVA